MNFYYTPRRRGYTANELEIPLCAEVVEILDAICGINEGMRWVSGTHLAANIDPVAFANAAALTIERHCMEGRFFNGDAIDSVTSTHQTSAQKSYLTKRETVQDTWARIMREDMAAE